MFNSYGAGFLYVFGHDKHSAVGNDTPVNPIDMIGIDMAAIPAIK